MLKPRTEVLGRVAKVEPSPAGTAQACVVKMKRCFAVEAPDFSPGFAT
jgi:hypothetical protein